MEPTLFEKSADLGQRLASSFALQQALDSLEEARKGNNPEIEQVQATLDMLCTALIALAGDDIAEA